MISSGDDDRIGDEWSKKNRDIWGFGDHKGSIVSTQAPLKSGRVVGGPGKFARAHFLQNICAGGVGPLSHIRKFIWYIV